jgi:hypothetical protein
MEISKEHSKSTHLQDILAEAASEYVRIFLYTM